MLRRSRAGGSPQVAEERSHAGDQEVGFLRHVVAADTHLLTLRLAGTFAPTAELDRQAERSFALTERLFDRTRAAGGLRPDLGVGDLTLLFEQLASVRLGAEVRTRQLRERYLALLLAALKAPEAEPLPGPPPTWDEIGQRWDP